MANDINQTITALAKTAESTANIVNNAKTRKLQQEAFAYNKEWNQKIFDEDLRRYNQTLEREDNAMQRAVADMRMAGLNPAMLSASATGGGASGSTPTQAQMLQAPNLAGAGLEGLTAIIPMLAEVQKTQAETEYIRSQTTGRTIENEILADTKEWEKAKSAESLRELKATAWAKEIEANMAEILKVNNITKAELEKDLLYLQKNVAQISERDARLFGIDENDTETEREAKMRKAYALIKNFDGDTQEYIKAYAEAKRAQEISDNIMDVGNAIGGIPGALLSEYGKRETNYGKKDSNYRWEGKRKK